MSRTFEDMYFKSIQPNFELYSKNPEYIEAAQLKEINYNELTDTLNESEKKRFEKFLDADGNLKEIEYYNTFTYAFKLGALLMVEIFAGSVQK